MKNWVVIIIACKQSSAIAKSAYIQHVLQTMSGVPAIIVTVDMEV